MMEQAHPGKGHNHAVLVGGFNDLVVPDGAAGLGDVLHAGLIGPLHVVAKGEEGVRAEGDPLQLCDPGGLVVGSQGLGTDGENALPGVVVGKEGGVGDVLVNGVVPVRAADAVDEGQGQDLGVLAQRCSLLKCMAYAYRVSYAAHCCSICSSTCFPDHICRTAL